ncbi:uncharacterized protein [Diabrotica undecimpunctata]|uniref:uncharacterized protein n=1 Tax=Diabrotica undecimpunctata TaxID=50387 RepID=UPI003B63D42E
MSNPRHLRITGPLSTLELNTSLLTLIKFVQSQSFPYDYDALSNSNQIDRRSKLLGLYPFFDTTTKLIRVGGRLHHSSFDFNKKHPIVLPSKHHLTKLIARHEHLKLLHIGPQALLASLRENYWPISGRNLVRKIVRDCVRCFRFNNKPEQHIMGNLPESRIIPSRPFTVSGVDYAGPVLLRDRKGRNYKTSKAYIALFICFASKAVHLEIVSDLTTECFLAALRRFTARRGKCSEIFSHNGSTFVRANNELRQFFDKNSHAITTDLSIDGIQWHFITPRAPHFGGLWESNIKSVKHHMKRVVGKAILTYEEFSTVLYQIEACLNSRPLYPLSNDPNDPNPLTPAHLLIGSSLTSIPQENLIDMNENRLSRFQRVQQLLQHFWTRWSKEYISHLQLVCCL